MGSVKQMGRVDIKDRFQHVIHFVGFTVVNVTRLAMVDGAATVVLSLREDRTTPEIS